jgi:hypothetical protein
MSHYAGVGAMSPDGQRIPTKTALKRLLLGEKKSSTEPAPSEVLFDVTDLLGDYAGQTFRGDDLPEGVSLQVVGPDPQTKRIWYATVTRTEHGITVK